MRKISFQIILSDNTEKNALLSILMHRTLDKLLVLVPELAAMIWIMLLQ